MSIPEPTVETFDALILGSGEAGKYLSWSLGTEGKKVALIERRYIGGSCPNIACLPSKNIVHSAKVAWYAQWLDAFGLHRPEPGIDMVVVRERKRAMIRDLMEVHEKRFAASHVELIRGQGTFTGSRTLLVALEEGGTRLLSAGLVIVSTGSRAAIPNVPGLRASWPLTHVEELELDKLPEHLVILGAGYVGLEFAQAMVRFGSRVTLIDQHERLLPHEDEVCGGGLRGQPPFTHIAYDDYRIVERTLTGESASTTGRQVSVHPFTDPNLLTSDSTKTRQSARASRTVCSSFR